MTLSVRFFGGGLALAFAMQASALDYRSPQRVLILFDAPASTAKKLAIAGRGLPLEVIVEQDAWVKVRDPSGRLAWAEKSALAESRQVMVKPDESAIRAQPRAESEVVLRATRGVLLEVTGEANAYGWLPVKHAAGTRGWLPAHEVWGR
jgi:SH3-like domain-containing protein